MAARAPRTHLPTHEVTNQPPLLEDYNLFETDLPLKEAFAREGAAAAADQVATFGATLGTECLLKMGRQANNNPPVLQTFDRFGHRVDEVNFDPAYHQLMTLGKEAGITGVAWGEAPVKGHVTHAALQYLLTQTEPGVCCPLCMTYAAIPVLRQSPKLAAQWEPGLTAPHYDPRSIPAAEKKGLTLGMAMTEKQGGSDVRSNTTTARPLSGDDYELTGHKWFCSAPMSDGFLTLAHTEGGQSCFLVPRWRPDGTRNPFLIQRLKGKLGNHANASSEIEYNETFGTLVGEEGRGVKTIIEMVHHTRLDCMVAATGLMRQAVAQAVHHAHHRSTFGKRLADHDLMQNVLADLALEVEATVALTFRVARSYDEGHNDPVAKRFSRLAVAVGKYWSNKRIIPVIGEALECHGGAGYVEEGPMPWLYREAPLNGIWEGSGNVICLDVLRALKRDPDSIPLLLNEIGVARGANRHLDATLQLLDKELRTPEGAEARARHLTELLAKAMQASLLIQHASNPIADAFCESRLGGRWGSAFGTLQDPSVFPTLIERARPQN